MAKNCINSKCGKEIPSSATFCSFCGTQQVEDNVLSEEEKLRKELSEGQETIQLLKKALTDAQKSKNSSAENLQTVENLQKQLADMQMKNKSLQNAMQTSIREKESKPFPIAILAVGLALLLVIGGLAGYFYFYRPYVTDRDAPRYYTFAVNTFLRSSQMAGVDYNILGKAPYGSELIVYNNDAEWASVKWNNTKGFMSSAFLLPKKDFYILNGIWGDDESKELISTGKCRIALLAYFKSKGFYGMIDPQICQEVFGVQYFPSENVWQVFSKIKSSKYNTTYYKRIIDKNSKFTDFAVIIKNPNTGERRCLFFGFSDDEIPYLIHEETAPSTGDIASIRRVNYSDSSSGYVIEYR
jgi:hypothetical protein